MENIEKYYNSLTLFIKESQLLNSFEDYQVTSEDNYEMLISMLELELGKIITVVKFKYLCLINNKYLIIFEDFKKELKGIFKTVMKIREEEIKIISFDKLREINVLLNLVLIFSPDCYTIYNIKKELIKQILLLNQIKSDNNNDIIILFLNDFKFINLINLKFRKSNISWNYREHIINNIFNFVGSNGNGNGQYKQDKLTDLTKLDILMKYSEEILNLSSEVKLYLDYHHSFLNLFGINTNSVNNTNMIGNNNNNNNNNNSEKDIYDKDNLSLFITNFTFLDFFLMNNINNNSARNYYLWNHLIFLNKLLNKDTKFGLKNFSHKDICLSFALDIFSKNPLDYSSFSFLNNYYDKVKIKTHEDIIKYITSLKKIHIEENKIIYIENLLISLNK